MNVLLLLCLLTAVLGAPSTLKKRSTPKAGLAWNNGPNANLTELTTSKVGWYYTWSPWAIPYAPSSLEFVPMFWSSTQLSDFQSQVNPMTIEQKGIKNILGMNEPDQTGEANLNAGQGAAMWKEYLEPLKTAIPSVRLGSPATTNAPNGKQWMYDFFGACGGGCSVDFVALHWYGLDNATDFIAHVTDYYNAFQRPIWVTEWACENYGDPSLGQCSDDQITEFLSATQSWMDKTDYVERYAWLGATSNIAGVNPENDLIGSNGQVTSLGKQYIGGQSSSSSGGNSSSGTSGGGSGVIPVSTARRNAFEFFAASFVLAIHFVASMI